jgi:hypothetical protein
LFSGSPKKRLRVDQIDRSLAISRQSGCGPDQPDTSSFRSGDQTNDRRIGTFMR